MFKDNLKKLRVEANLTQEELAEKLFVSRSAIAKWEQGRGIPKTDTIEEIAKLFNVSVDSFYQKDEPQKVIENIERNNKRSFTIFIIAMLVIISLVFIIMKDKKIKIEYDTFYSEETLEEYSLKGLDAIKQNSDGSINWDDSYYVNIDSYDVYYNYVKYVFNYLQNSPYISYVGFRIEKPTKQSSYLDKKNYILTSNNLEDYNESQYFDGKLYNSTYYSFYYLPVLDMDHESKEELEFNFIYLHFQQDMGSWIMVDNVEYKTNFRMSIHSTKDYGYGDYYLYYEYFDLEKVEIDQTNFDDYFYIQCSDNTIHGSSAWYYIWSKEYFFKSYLPLSIQIGEGDRIESKNTILREPNNGHDVKLSEAYGVLEDGEIKYKYEVIVEKGYIYRVIPK